MEPYPTPIARTTGSPRITGASHRRFHRLLDGGAEKVCSYCAVPLVCSCDDLLPCGDAFVAPPGTAFFHLDHVIPRAAGGPDLLENLTPSCGPCNVEKAA